MAAASHRSPAAQGSFIAVKDANGMNQLMDSPGAQSRIVIVGAGCARYHCAGYTGTEVAAQGQLGHPDVFAAGDAAAVPDLTRPGQLTAMTAQHAQRQGKA